MAAALARWRAEAYGAARVQQVVADAMGSLPAPVAAGLDAADPLTDPALATRPRTLGARASRALVGLLGADPGAALGPARPVAAPGNAARPLAPVHAQGTAGLLTGLAVPGVEAGSAPAALLNQLSAAPAVAVTAAPRGRGPGAGGGPGRRAARQPGGRGRGPGRRGRDRRRPGRARWAAPEAARRGRGRPAAEQDGDALDELIRRATQRRDRRP